MDKNNWEYKELEDCLHKVKYPPKVKTNEYLSLGLYPVVSQEKEYISGYNDDENKVFHHNNPVVIFGDHSREIKYIDFDFIIGADGVKILDVKDFLNPKFFYYNIKWINVESLGYSRHYKLLKENKIPIPPLAEQERIVAELDLLSSIIEKKKAQLKELDQLAQSIFYDMFGDPITNEKGWEVKKLGEVCLLKAGKAIRSAELKEKTDNTFPCYGGNGIRGYINKVSHKKDLPIIGRQGALCGNVNYAKAPFYATEHAVVVTPLIEMDMKWLYNELKLLQLEQYAHGVAQPGIAVSDLIPISFPLPPLPLQQEFASKIEAIERQKSLIQQSIVETQTLFDSRMDYWFG